MAAGVVMPNHLIPFTESIIAEANDQTAADPGAVVNPEVTPEAPVQPEAPVVPEAPVQPEAPVAPEAPVQPTEPENPSNPTDPNNPGAVVDPSNPADPSNPGAVVDPSNPADPSNPGAVVDPTNPVDPSNPGTVVDPTNPTDPSNPGTVVDPSNPTDPSNPDNPVNPGDPSNPVNPDDPNNPVNPDDPNNPVNPDDPNNPVNPDDPNNPDNPDDSNNPVNPDDPSNPDNPDDPNNPDNPDDPSNPDNPDDPDHTFDPDNPDIPWDPTLPVIPVNPEKPEPPKEPGFGEGLDGIFVDPDELKPEEVMPSGISNANLIMNKKLVKLPKIVEDFRFWTVARKYAFAREDMVIREAMPAEEITDETIRKKMPEDAVTEENIRTVGSLTKNGLLYILKEEENGWLYVESGRVRGFVRAEEVITGEEAVPQLEAYQNEAKVKAEEAQTEYTGIEAIVPMAVEALPWQHNRSFTYLRATVDQTVAVKNYAIAENESVEVKEDRNDESRVIGVIPKGGLCYILQDIDQEWMYVESGDVRGFVRNGAVQYGEEITKKVEEKTEEKFSLAEEKIKPEENGSCYYTLTSTKPGVPDGEIRRSMIEFAAQFVGNPYVWGGTSLTEGADCSGFVQSIYKQYGYDIPRVSRDQAEYGTAIPVEDALPGDLIFYANNGYIHHVVMYAGGGKTIEAMSTDTGIVQADVNKNEAVWAVRILKDNGYGYAGGGIGDVNASPNMYGTNLGTFKLTYYCACEICCDVETGITATGAPVVEGRTIAVDPRVIPYGTQVIIGGHIFTAEDCGGAIKENHIDIYVNDHATALALGVNYADVYLKK